MDPDRPAAATGSGTPPAPSAAAAVAALAALAVSTFCYVTSESLPIGLLAPIAADLEVSLPQVGLLVSGYGLTVAVVSVPLTQATRRVPRRLLLSGVLALFAAATLVSALAASYPVLLAARLVSALTHGVFWSVVAVTAAGLFAPRLRGRVVSVVFAGSSLAGVLGVPAGTWLGQQAGWRAAFVALSVLVVAMLAVFASTMPSGPAGVGHAARGRAPDVRRYVLLLVATALMITGVFTAYTYTTDFLTSVPGFPASAISALLLVNGVAGVVGVAVAGAATERSPRWALLAAAGTMAAAQLGLYALGESRPAAVALLALSSFSIGLLAAALQVRVLDVAPGSADLASAGTSSAFNLGIGLGALLGGLLLPALGVRSTALVGGLLVAAALAVLLTEPLLAPARPTGPAGTGSARRG
ncbi:MFS transporter [Allonocardiopsis opalescens]|uniref:DHA1 family inner membrane transport protein n=1 Tax=Allonocardiopsis opalescens TaxID=1144618 RepID=A0A2T0Q089_9ACTN|nr:MFS transporter [Allonocardiopsis opalescens]PRX97125.1 DHA1 family inner membrane transport protein [Allonocardiopsis opalescens]